MADPLRSELQVPLPKKVEDLITLICQYRNHPPPDFHTRERLFESGEEAALEVLSKVFNHPAPIRTLDGFIVHLLKGLSQSPNTPASSTPEAKLDHFYSPVSPACASPQNLESSGHQTLKRHVGSSSSNLEAGRPNRICRQLQFPDISGNKEVARPQSFSYQARVFSREVDFRREFLIYNYIGGEKLEEVISDEVADEILEIKDEGMDVFEARIWNACGRKYCSPEDRRQGVDWNSEKSFVYYCQVSRDGNCRFKGPQLSTATTHLQRTLGDDNVLIVKFLDVPTFHIQRILRQGILIGLKRFHFFVFKDEVRDKKKKKGREMGETPVSTAVKCYFIRLECLPAFVNKQSSVPSLNNLRCHFMHVHTVSSLAKYIARFSLILSKTIKLPIDLSRVVIETIEDIPCQDGNGSVIRDEAGEDLILTDGTGYISEDLAMACPQNFLSAKYMKEKDFKKIHQSLQMVSVPYEGGVVETWNREPPLLMQCRLFSKGSAVKGTLLLNRKLGAGKIQIRPSMVKVGRDVNCNIAPTFDSLEIVAISHKPKRCLMSKNLIALLSYGGVPRNFFLDLLNRALEQIRSVYSDWIAALKVAIANGDMDDNATAARMISAGVPLNEPHLRTRLATLARHERRGLGEGKLPIRESFYLMGTVDPTGTLKRDQVCVILENGQISGKVLVYRNPGLHFGDIHILEAVYVKELEDVVGNAKYGIFFSTKGQRSVATEMANGDFDGDHYWVSRNPELLRYFSPSKPWTRVYSTPSAANMKPSELKDEELENELIQLVLDKQKPSYTMAVAADSWISFMDRLLILGDDNKDETEELRQKILELIDIYYDALDAPKTGKKVNVPRNLQAERFPHYMRRRSSYVSTSVLGDIFDKAEQFQNESQPTREIWKLPCFNAEIPAACTESWKKRYEDYRHDMREAMEIKDEKLKKSAADSVIHKYKEMLYEASELEESPRHIRDIYNDALAIYHANYDHALHVGDITKCGFAWRVAGSALCKYHATRTSANEDPILMVPSVLRNALS